MRAWEPADIPSHAPLEDHPLDPRCEPSALEGWVLEIICCDPKGNRAVLRILFTEGRGVRLWALSTPKGPEWEGEVFAYPSMLGATFRPIGVFICLEAF